MGYNINMDNVPPPSESLKLGLAAKAFKEAIPSIQEQSPKSMFTHQDKKITAYSKYFSFLTSGDEKKIAETLNTHGIEALDVANALKKSYDQAPSIPEQQDNTFQQWYTLVIDTTNVVSTSLYLKAAEINNRLIKDKPNLDTRDFDPEDKEVLKIEQRIGIQDNIAAEIAMTMEDNEIDQLKPDVDELVNLRQTAYKEDLEADKVYLRKKLDLETKYLKLIVQRINNPTSLGQNP